MMRAVLFTALLALAARQSGPGDVVATNGSDAKTPPRTGQGEPAFPGQTRAPAVAARLAFRVERVAAGLSHPWSLAFLPDGRMLVTERPGTLRIVARDGTLSEPVAGLPTVMA